MLSVIAKGYFGSSTVMFFPIVALVIFLVIFTILSIRAFIADPDVIREASLLPLANDQSPIAKNKESSAAR